MFEMFGNFLHSIYMELWNWNLRQNVDTQFQLFMFSTTAMAAIVWCCAWLAIVDCVKACGWLCCRRAMLRDEVMKDAVEYFQDTYDRKWLEEQVDHYEKQSWWSLCWTGPKTLDRTKKKEE
jgi:hypothetical protein